MTENLSKKVERAIKLLQSIPQHEDEPIESATNSSYTRLERRRRVRVYKRKKYQITPSVLSRGWKCRHLAETRLYVLSVKIAKEKARGF